MEPYNIELAEGAKPYHLKRPYTIPQAYSKNRQTRSRTDSKI